MKSTEKLNLLISQFANQEFDALEVTFATRSTPVDITWDTIINNDVATAGHRYEGKSVLNAVLDAWNQKSYRTYTTHTDAAKSRFIETGSPAMLALLQAYIRSKYPSGDYDFGRTASNPHVPLLITLTLDELVMPESSLSLTARDRFTSLSETLLKYYDSQNGGPVSSQQIQQSMLYCERAIQMRLVLLAPSAWYSTLQKIFTLQTVVIDKRFVHKLLHWMELDPLKWSSIVSDAGVAYRMNSISTDSNFCTSSNLSLDTSYAIKNTYHLSSLVDLKRQFTEIIAYRFRCYITQQQETSAFLPSFLAPGEKRFYTDYLKPLLPHITQALHQAHNSNASATPDFSWLMQIINDCLDKPYSKENRHSLRQIINALNIKAAPKLAGELSTPNNQSFSASVDMLVTQALTSAATMQASSSSVDLSTFQKTLKGKTTEKGHIIDLPAIWHTINSNKTIKISLLTKEEQEELLDKAKTEFVRSGSDASFEILCRFYDENLPMADDIDEKNDGGKEITIKNQFVLRELVYLYRTNHTVENNNAADFFKRLLDRKIMFFNSRFKFGTQATLLHVAVCSGFTDIVDFLIQQGADPNWLDGGHYTAVQLALNKLNDPNSIFIKTSEEDQRQKIIQCLIKVINYYKFDWSGNTYCPSLLVFAVQNNCDADLFEILLSSIYCDPNAQYQNHSPLMWLVQQIFKNTTQDSSQENLLALVQRLLIHPKIKLHKEEKNGIFYKPHVYHHSTAPSSVYQHVIYAGDNHSESTAIIELSNSLIIADTIIDLCSQTQCANVEMLQKIISEYTTYHKFLQQIFTNHFNHSQPQHLGKILQQVRQTRSKLLEDCMKLNGDKWSLALSDAGQSYLKNAQSTSSSLSKHFANKLHIDDNVLQHSHAIELRDMSYINAIASIPTELRSLYKQLQTAMRYRLRCYLENIVGEKNFYTIYLSSLLPLATDFMHEKMCTINRVNPEQWLKDMLTECLKEAVSETDARILGAALYELNFNKLIEEKLGEEFYPAFKTMNITGILNTIAIANEEHSIDDDEEEDASSNPASSGGALNMKKVK